MTNSNIEYTPKTNQDVIAITHSGRSNLLVFNLMRLLRYTRNDDYQLFEWIQYLKYFITFDLVSKNMRVG